MFTLITSNLMSQVILHCKQSIESQCISNEYDWSYNGNQIDIIVDNVDIKDDIDFCNYHGIDYNEVNSIELI